MNYLLYKDFKFNNDFLNDLKGEFLKAKKINIFYHENNKVEIEDFLRKEKLENKLINIYSHNLDIKYKKFYRDICEEDIKILENINGFNCNQYLASIYAAEKNLLINAGAGTGKTTTIVETVINLLLDGDAELEDILMTTFTNNSTNDIYDKIYSELIYRWEITGNKRCLSLLENINDLTICTLHKYLTTVLEQLGAWYGYSNNIKLTQSKDQLKRNIQKIIDSKFKEDGFSRDEYGMYDNIARKLILDIIINEKVNISKIDEYNICNEDDSSEVRKISGLIKEVVNEISREFMKDLIDKDKVLMNNLNYKINDMIIYDNNFDKKLKKYKYIFVDECQDTSSTQFNILKYIIKLNDSKVFAVGDSLQAIYRFRDADIESMANFEGISDEKLNLLDNYRTKKEILDHINFIFSNLRKGYKNLKAQNSGGENIIIKRFFQNDKYRNNTKKYEILKDILREEIISINKKREKNENKNNKRDRIAILVRNNYEIKKISYELKEAGIQCSTEKEGSLYQSKAARDLLALIRLILYPNSNIYKAQLVKTNYCNFKFDINSVEFLREYDFSLLDLVYKDIEKILNESEKKTAFSILNDIIYKINPGKDDKFYRENLLLVLQEFINNKVTYSFSDMERFLDINLSTDNSAKSSEERNAEDSVFISTFHATKGLEFDTVILFADSNYYRNISSDNGKTDITIDKKDIGFYYDIKNNNYDILNNLENRNIIKDEENLLYVAMTRAREKLYLLIPSNITEETHGEILEKGGVFSWTN